jgi:gluconolactonase
MAATETPRAVASAARVPGPPELLPGRPDAIVDLQTEAGAALVGGQWRYCDARLEEVEFVELAGPGTSDPLGPGTVPNRTYDVVPHAQAADFDDSGWTLLAPEDTMRRLSTGRVCFDWYRVEVTIPERVGAFDPTGATVVFEVVVDDYAEVWVDGEMPHALGDAGGPVVAGFNAPNRVLLTRDARPGDRFVIAVFGINGPISASPANYIWMRTATLDFYAPERAKVGEPVRPGLVRLATGFEFTEGPVWSPDAALLFASGHTIYRLDPGLGRVTVFRPKSGEPSGLAFSPDGRLTICQRAAGRVIRVNPHGDVGVLAELDEPRDLVYASDGTLYLTAASGAHRVAGGELSLLGGESAAGIALSPDERWLYVGDSEAIIRYDLAAGRVEPLCEIAGRGIAVAADGSLFVCGPGGIWVLSAEGERLGLIELPEAPHNLAWGGDGALYITALTSIYRLQGASR